MNIKSLWKTCWILCAALLVLPGCGGGNDNGTGTLSVGLTDGPTEDYSGVYVTIDAVQVHLNGSGDNDTNGWVTIATPQKTYNLLDLTDGVVEGLGQGSLAAGSYSQIRLIIGTTPDGSPNLLCLPHPFANYVIDADDNEIHELKVPSGEQSGLKIVCGGKCDVVENQTTELILDFDAAASVVVAGNSGNYNLKPTIKVLGTEAFSIVTGFVSDLADGSALPGATISGQIFTPGAPDPINQILIQSSTQSDAIGEYELFLRPGAYNLVASLEGFAPAATAVTTAPGQVLAQDFQLAEVDTGLLSGTVSVAGGDPALFVHTSFRETTTLAGTPIEVLSIDTQNGGSYSVNLPVLLGSSAVSSTCGFPTQETPFVLTADSQTLLDVAF